MEERNTLTACITGLLVEAFGCTAVNNIFAIPYQNATRVQYSKFISWDSPVVAFQEVYTVRAGESTINTLGTLEYTPSLGAGSTVSTRGFG